MNPAPRYSLRLCLYVETTEKIKTAAINAIIPARENDDNGSLSSPLMPIQITNVKNRNVPIKAGSISRWPIQKKNAGTYSAARSNMAKLAQEIKLPVGIQSNLRLKQHRRSEEHTSELQSLA